MKMKAGMIGFIPKGADKYAVWESYAKMGYSAIETGAPLFDEGDPAENAARVRGMGLEILSLHTDVSRGNETARELAEKAHTIGVKLVVTYHTSATLHRFADSDAAPTQEELTQELAKFEKLSRALHDEGLTLLLHNHDAEFYTSYKGVPYFWALMAGCEHLGCELDVGWVTYAQQCPAYVISQLGSRVKALHIKDYLPGKHVAPNKTREIIVPRFCAPGAGELDMYACLKAGAEAGVPWAVIEQDELFLLNTAEAVQAAFYNMKETGFVE